jgi:hypothetical protein
MCGLGGGLSGFPHILANIPNPFGTNGVSNLGVNLKLLPATCYIITSSGIIPYRDDATSDAFSGGPRTQLVGLTICALAYFLNGAFAVRTFMRCLQ